MDKEFLVIVVMLIALIIISIIILQKVRKESYGDSQQMTFKPVGVFSTGGEQFTGSDGDTYNLYASGVGIPTWWDNKSTSVVSTVKPSSNYLLASLSSEFMEPAMCFSPNGGSCPYIFFPVTQTPSSQIMSLYNAVKGGSPVYLYQQ